MTFTEFRKAILEAEGYSSYLHYIVSRIAQCFSFWFDATEERRLSARDVVLARQKVQMKLLADGVKRNEEEIALLKRHRPYF